MVNGLNPSVIWFDEEHDIDKIEGAEQAKQKNKESIKEFKKEFDELEKKIRLKKWAFK